MMQASIQPAAQRLGQYCLARSVWVPIGVFFAGLLLVLPPGGEFPLNDDWIYAKTVEHLLLTGQYQAHPYLNATLVVQAFWGALFCKMFGFSFTVLRVSTLVLAGVNAWAIARCGLMIGLSRPLALACAVTVATSPLVLQLSYSFMTDVPFLTFSSLSGLCFLGALRQRSDRWIWGGSSFAVLAYLVRQFGLLLPLAFLGVISWLTVRRHWSFSKGHIMALVVPWLFVMGLYQLWGNHLQSQTPILVPNHHLAGTLLDGIRHIPVAFCYMGLFCLPIGIGRLWQLCAGRDRWSKQRWWLGAGLVTTALFCFGLPQLLYRLNILLRGNQALWLKAYPYRLPLMLHNTWIDWGLGPLQLPQGQPKPLVSIGSGWWILTLLALLVAVMLWLACLDRLRAAWQLPGTAPILSYCLHQDLFLMAWGGLSLAAAYNPLRIDIVDRYFLPGLVPFILLLARDFRPAAQRQSLRWIAPVIVAVALTSVILVQDYLAWNRAAWVAHRQLTEEYQVPAAQVQGIDTFSGWYNSEAYMAQYGQSWWDFDIGGKGPWVLGDNYMINSAAPLSGYTEIDRIQYVSWLGMQPRSIVICRRTETPPSRTSAAANP